MLNTIFWIFVGIIATPVVALSAISFGLSF